MSTELRSAIRQIEDLIKKESIDEAFNFGIESIENFDKEREYIKSQKIIEKLLKYDFIDENQARKNKLYGHLIIRALLNGTISDYEDIIKSNPELSNLIFSKISVDLMNLLKQKDETEYNLESIERVDIFGDVTPLLHVPSVDFNDEDELIRIIEDFYENGIYHLNYVQKTSLLQQSLSILIGKKEEVNVMEKRGIIKI